MDGWDRRKGRNSCAGNMPGSLPPELLVTTLLYTETTDIDIRWMEGRPRPLTETAEPLMSWRHTTWPEDLSVICDPLEPFGGHYNMGTRKRKVCVAADCDTFVLGFESLRVGLGNTL